MIVYRPVASLTTSLDRQEPAVSIAAPAQTMRRTARLQSSDKSPVWSWLQRALSVTVIAAAVITGVQLGVNAPAVSPVQPATVPGASTTNSSTALAAPNQQALPAAGRNGPGHGHDKGGR
ncbi:hypothetical protein [Arthrobacter sp. NA-172]|uniref:hypothetical protein n=1 Tax=Arthrobacter sp. NA-172 TaxID=3367524 RepID=UPI003754580E